MVKDIHLARRKIIRDDDKPRTTDGSLLGGEWMYAKIIFGVGYFYN
jgi:hypothetical protein